MKNLLGQDEYFGKTLVEGICQAYQDADVKVHMYGKTMTKPFRKMGHLTVCASDVDEALSKARQAYDKIKIKGEDKA
jgi:5-(carboxyamino)imidazole ribonucleotide synthase